MMIEIHDLIGKPYKTHGRGPDAFDCYGLVIEVEKRLGRSLPDYFYTETGKDFNSRLIDETKPTIGARRVESPSLGDVIVLRSGERPTHVGVCLGDGNFIHCGKHGVRVETVSSWTKRTEGFYRW